jgi:hypothetical protein
MMMAAARGSHHQFFGLVMTRRRQPSRRVVYANGLQFAQGTVARWIDGNCFGIVDNGAVWIALRALRTSLASARLHLRRALEGKQIAVRH